MKSRFQDSSSALRFCAWALTLYPRAFHVAWVCLSFLPSASPGPTTVIPSPHPEVGLSGIRTWICVCPFLLPVSGLSTPLPNGPMQSALMSVQAWRATAACPLASLMPHSGQMLLYYSPGDSFGLSAPSRHLGPHPSQPVDSLTIEKQALTAGHCVIPGDGTVAADLGHSGLQLLTASCASLGTTRKKSPPYIWDFVWFYLT